MGSVSQKCQSFRRSRSCRLDVSGRDCGGLLSCLLVLLLASLGGCAPERAARLSGASDDFIIDATILTGASAREGLRVEARQSKFVLMPDGMLLAGEGPSIQFNRRPARVRVLGESQVADMRALASNLGFLAVESADGRGNPSSLQPAEDEVLHILWFRDDQKEWWFARRWKLTDSPDPAATRLVRTLGMMAWAHDLTAQEFDAHRYDFGSDPYAAYRAGGVPSINQQTIPAVSP
ncbi:MAG: hypothetical protein EXS00_03275 [Phycisphaerales bacterium]|nr:hypothetical protein [Phycisphaerales bacterium]